MSNASEEEQTPQQYLTTFARKLVSEGKAQEEVILQLGVYNALNGQCLSSLQIIAIAKAASLGKPRESSGVRPVVLAAINYSPEAVEWLWYPYIPLRKITLLQGDPGCGKTWLALAIAAALSVGKGLPDEKGRPVSLGNPRTTLYLSREDSISDTLLPRFLSAGGNPQFLYLLTSLKERSGAEHNLYLSSLNCIAQALGSTQPSLVVVDPIQDWLGPTVDMNRANEVRPILSALSNLMAKYNASVLLLGHLTKGNTSKAIYRGLGSVDFSAVARSILLLARNGRQRHLVHIKSSASEEGPSLMFEIRAGNFSWVGLSSFSSREALADELTQDDMRSAAHWLLEQLCDGPRPARELCSEAVEIFRFSPRTLPRIRAQLNLIAYQEKGKWWWAVPTDFEETPGE